MAFLRFTILGCGSSGGVPRLGGQWGACDPKNPKNRRRRCSMLVQRIDGGEATSVLIDTSPDMREQLLDAEIGTLDAVAYTHMHADHIHGIDDLRMIVMNRQSRLPVWADGPTAEALVDRFGYAFVQPHGSAYPPILDLFRIEENFTIEGAGGAITLEPFEVVHGRIRSLGFRIGGLVYLPDVSDMTYEAWEAVQNLDIWVLDALRYKPHPTHAHLERSLEWIEMAAPKRAILTNMHCDIDFETVDSETPDHISPAFDGMVLELPQ